MEPTATTAPSLPRSIEEIRAEFPILARAGPRAAARLPRQRRHRPEAARGDRHPRPLLARAQRQRPPRRSHPLRGGDLALRGGPGDDRLASRRRPARGGLRPQRDGGPQPGRLLVGPNQHLLPATGSSSRRWSTTPTWSPGTRWPRRGTPISTGRRSTTRAGSTWRRSPPCSSADRSSSASPTSRTCSARSTRSLRSPAWPTTRARCWSSTAHRPGRSSSSTWPSSARTSTRSPPTSSTGRPASARSSAAGSCSRRCRPSSGAAR